MAMTAQNDTITEDMAADAIRRATWPSGAADLQDGTTLVDAGLDSLAVLRLAAEFGARSNAEIQPEKLFEIKTVGELRDWLVAIANPPLEVTR